MGLLRIKFRKDDEIIPIEGIADVLDYLTYKQKPFYFYYYGFDPKKKAVIREPLYLKHDLKKYRKKDQEEYERRKNLFEQSIRSKETGWVGCWITFQNLKDIVSTLYSEVKGGELLESAFNEMGLENALLNYNPEHFDFEKYFYVMRENKWPIDENQTQIVLFINLDEKKDNPYSFDAAMQVKSELEIPANILDPMVCKIIPKDGAEVSYSGNTIITPKIEITDMQSIKQIKKNLNYIDAVVEYTSNISE